MNDDFISVTSLNDYVKKYLDQNKILNHVRVRGEVLNIKKYSTSAYFALKDEKDARISVVMFLRGLQVQNINLNDGDDVIVTGQVTLYTKGGTYQLIAHEVDYYGEGAKLLALKKLREKLNATGIFDESKKLSIPKFAQKIGVICGKDSAAWADIRQNITRRYPLAQLYYFPTLVQGRDASKALISSFKKAETYDLDVLIVARGGGSSDDLWAFNNEELIVALSKRKTPLISAVGHEIDTTLVDYVSDLRVSTPTAAAEHAVENQNDLLQDINRFSQSLDRLLTKRLEVLTERLINLARRPVLVDPQNIIVTYNAKINDLSLRVNRHFERTYHQNINQIMMFDELISAYITRIVNNKIDVTARLNASLVALSPLSVLERGYAIITDKNGKIIKDIKDIEIEDTIIAKLNKQALVATVKEKYKDE